MARIAFKAQPKRYGRGAKIYSAVLITPRNLQLQTKESKMKNRKLKIRSLGLAALAALGLMASFAASAQAEGEWKVGGKTLTELGKTEASTTGTASEAFKLAIPWYESELSCKTLTTENGKILSGGGGHSTFSLSACTLSGPPFVVEACKLIEPIAVKVKDLLIYHNANGKTYDLFQAAEAGKPLTTVQFKEGTECPLPLKNEVTGSFVGEFQTTELIKRAVSVNSTTEKTFATHTLKFGSHPATLKGSMALALTGSFEGKPWSGEVPQPKKEWKIGGKTLEKLELKEEEVQWEVSEAFVISTDTNGLGFVLEVSCGALESEAEKTMILKGGLAKVSLLLTSCKLLGEIGSYCEVIDPAKFTAVHNLVFHNGKTYHLFSPAESWLLTMEFKPIGPEGFCFFGGSMGYKGSLVAEAEEGERLEQPLTFNSSVTALFPTHAFVSGPKAATVKGKAKLRLSGANKGAEWTGIG